MKLYTTIIIGLNLLTLMFSSCDNKRLNDSANSYWSDTTHLSADEKAQRNVWMDFKQTVLSNDLTAFKKLSAPCIYCSRCDANDSNVGNDTLEAEHHIPTDQFIKKDFQNVFSKEANEFYFNDDNVTSIGGDDSPNAEFGSCLGLSQTIGYKEVFVTISDRNCSGEECSQTFFAFVNDGKGYKFYSMMDMP